MEPRTIQLDIDEWKLVQNEEFKISKGQYNNGIDYVDFGIVELVDVGLINPRKESIIYVDGNMTNHEDEESFGKQDMVNQTAKIDVD